MTAVLVAVAGAVVAAAVIWVAAVVVNGRRLMRDLAERDKAERWLP